MENQYYFEKMVEMKNGEVHEFVFNSNQLRELKKPSRITLFTLLNRWLNKKEAKVSLPTCCCC